MIVGLLSTRCVAGAGRKPWSCLWPCSSRNTPSPSQGQLAAVPPVTYAEMAALHVGRSMAGFLSEVCFPGETTTI